MAKFITSIPAGVKDVRELIPQGSYFEKAVYNPETDTVDVYWEQDLIKGRFQGPVAYPLELLQFGEPPEGFTSFVPTQKPQSVDAPPKAKAKRSRA